MAIDGQPAEPFAAREGRVTLAPAIASTCSSTRVLEPGSVAPIVVQSDRRRARSRGSSTAATRAHGRHRALKRKPLPRILARPHGFPRRAADHLRLRRPPTNLPARRCSRSARARTVMLASGTARRTLVCCTSMGHSVRLLDALGRRLEAVLARYDSGHPATEPRHRVRRRHPGKWLLQARMIGADGKPSMAVVRGELKPQADRRSANSLR